MVQEKEYRSVTKSTYPVPEMPKHPVLDGDHALRNFGLFPQTSEDELEILVNEEQNESN